VLQRHGEQRSGHADEGREEGHAHAGIAADVRGHLHRTIAVQQKVAVAAWRRCADGSAARRCCEPRHGAACWRAGERKREAAWQACCKRRPCCKPRWLRGSTASRLRWWWQLQQVAGRQQHGVGQRGANVSGGMHSVGGAACGARELDCWPASKHAALSDASHVVVHHQAPIIHQPCSTDGSKDDL
jgi:hypothetical protein